MIDGELEPQELPEDSEEETQKLQEESTGSTKYKGGPIPRVSTGEKAE